MRRNISNKKLLRPFFSLLLALCFMLALLPGVAPTARAAALEVYVNQATGDDLSGDGSQGSPYRTIQKAVNAAPGGSTVHVAAGTYPENVTINRSISLVGASAETTIIDGGFRDRCVNIANVSVVIENLTIQHGKAPDGITSSHGYDGGGIFCYASLIVTECTITGNKAGDGGYAVSLDGFGGDGGGIYCDSLAVISASSITSNAAGNGRPGGNGGGVYADRITMTGTRIASNTAGLGLHGGAAGACDLLYARSGSADNNWWGLNGGPGTDDTNIPVSKWLVMSMPASNPVSVGQTAPVTVSLTMNNVGEEVTDVFSGGTVSITATAGTVNPSPGISGGTATAAYTAPSSTAAVTLTAALDNESVTAQISVEMGIREDSLSFILNKAGAVSLTPESTEGTLTWSAGGLPAGLSIDEDWGVIFGTPTQAGSFIVTVTLTDVRAGATMTVTKDIIIDIRTASGNGAYLIVSDGDPAYTGSYTGEGIPTLTVNPGVTGFTYFRVNISAVMGHGGTEVCVFVHTRNGVQLGFSFNEGDFDPVGAAGAAFNVQAGDVIEVYIVDALTNGAAGNPNVL